jgi:hypothetical protein
VRRHLAAGVVVLLVAWPCAGQGKGKLPDRVLSAVVSFSVDEYDPATPAKATVTCAVRNNGPYPAHVPVGFDGGYVRLEAGGLTLSRIKRDKDDVRLAWVEPGKEQVVFQLPLDDVLLRTNQADATWHWDWARRPAPPPSPIHRGRQGGYVEQASFVVTVDLGTRTLKSEPAVLKVKGGGEK